MPPSLPRTSIPLASAVRLALFGLPMVSLSLVAGQAMAQSASPVSYTHLTLPTNRGG